MIIGKQSFELTKTYPNDSPQKKILKSPPRIF